MSRGFGRVEASIIEQVMRSGIVAVPLLRFSQYRLMGGGGGRPFIFGSPGSATPMLSRQSANRALLKLEAAKVVYRVVRSDGSVLVKMTEAVARRSFRVAGEAFMAHFAGNLRAASLEGLQLASRDHDIEISAGGASAEQKIVELYGFDEPAAEVRISKRDQKALKKMTEDNITRIARLAENLIISKKLSADRIKQLIEKPLEGE